jgi:hypothetical protein
MSSNSYTFENPAVNVGSLVESVPALTVLLYKLPCSYLIVVVWLNPEPNLFRLASR